MKALVGGYRGVSTVTSARAWASWAGSKLMAASQLSTVPVTVLPEKVRNSELGSGLVDGPPQRRARRLPQGPGPGPDKLGGRRGGSARAADGDSAAEECHGGSGGGPAGRWSAACWRCSPPIGSMREKEGARSMIECLSAPGDMQADQHHEGIGQHRMRGLDDFLGPDGSAGRPAAAGWARAAHPTASAASGSWWWTPETRISRRAVRRSSAHRTARAPARPARLRRAASAHGPRRIEQRQAMRASVSARMVMPTVLCHWIRLKRMSRGKIWSWLIEKADGQLERRWRAQWPNCRIIARHCSLRSGRSSDGKNASVSPGSLSGRARHRAGQRTVRERMGMEAAQGASTGRAIGARTAEAPACLMAGASVILGLLSDEFDSIVSLTSSPTGPTSVVTPKSELLIVPVAEKPTVGFLLIGCGFRAAFSFTSSVTGLVTPWKVRSPVTVPVYFARRLELLGNEGDLVEHAVEEHLAGDFRR